MIMIRRDQRRAEEGPTRFLPGDLVRHRRYGYRGVVVDFDLSCTAPEEWYQSNQTQPPKDQPWYHVLVHDSQHTTYAAEGNLQADESREEIRHPLLALYFERFEGDGYVRNERPWGLE